MNIKKKKKKVSGTFRQGVFIQSEYFERCTNMADPVKFVRPKPWNLPAVFSYNTSASRYK